MPLIKPGLSACAPGVWLSLGVTQRGGSLVAMEHETSPGKMHTRDPAALNTQKPKLGAACRYPRWRPWGESSEHKQCWSLGSGRGSCEAAWFGGRFHFTSLSQHFDFLRLELSAMTIPFEKN